MATDWFIMLFAPVVTGWDNYFGIGLLQSFMVLVQKCGPYYPGPPQAFTVYDHCEGCWLVMIQWNRVIKGNSPGDLISAISHSLVSGGAFGENSNTTSVSSEFWDLASNSAMPTLTSDSLLIFKTFQSSIPEKTETITSCADTCAAQSAEWVSECECWYTPSNAGWDTEFPNSKKIRRFSKIQIMDPSFQSWRHFITCNSY